ATDAKNGELDALGIEYQGALRAYDIRRAGREGVYSGEYEATNLRNQSTLLQFEGSQARAAGNAKGTSTILTGLGTATDKGFRAYQDYDLRRPPSGRTSYLTTPNGP